MKRNIIKNLKINKLCILSQHKVKFIFGRYLVLFNYNTSKTLCSACDNY